MLWLELAVVLASIVIGATVGGAGLGTVAGIGLAVLVFVFGLPPSSPPGEVLAIIVAVVTATASMQAAGGMDLLVSWAERALRAHPKSITFVAPLVAYAFTFFAGTGHVAYAILPVIAEVSRKAGVRPERPMSISVIASQQAITASPLSAATAGMIALLGGSGVTLGKLLAVCVPSTLVGVMAGALAVSRMGVELDQDEGYKRRLAEGRVEPPKPLPKLEGAARRNALLAVSFFALAGLSIIAFGLIPSIRPAFPPVSDPEAEAAALGMPVLIQLVMYAAAGLMMLFAGARPDVAVTSSIGRAGVIAVISIVGLGWLGGCFFHGNRAEIVGGLEHLVQAHPWIFAIALFTLSILLFSQAATVAAMMPVGVSLGLAPATLLAFFPAVNGYFFLPTYGTIVAAVAFDPTGTTRIGRYVVNHSFMRAGLVSTIVALGVGFAISRAIG
ncbi:MAG: anaerobic C4-dicarboxylate transporter [Phycisphaerales bacterium]